MTLLDDFVLSITKLKNSSDSTKSESTYIDDQNKSIQLLDIDKLISHSAFQYSIGIEQLQNLENVKKEISRLDAIQHLLKYDEFTNDIDLKNSKLSVIQNKIKFFNALKRLRNHTEFNEKTNIESEKDIFIELNRLYFLQKLKLHPEFAEFNGNLTNHYTDILIQNEISRLNYISKLKQHPMIKFNKLNHFPDDEHFILNEIKRLDTLLVISYNYPEKINEANELDICDINDFYYILVAINYLKNHQFYRNNIDELYQYKLKTNIIDFYNTRLTIKKEIKYLDFMINLIEHPLYKNNIELFKSSSNSIDQLEYVIYQLDLELENSMTSHK